jgi:hypothetical protein
MVSPPFVGSDESLGVEELVDAIFECIEPRWSLGASRDVHYFPVFFDAEVIEERRSERGCFLLAAAATIICERCETSLPKVFTKGIDGFRRNVSLVFANLFNNLPAEVPQSAIVKDRDQYAGHQPSSHPALVMEKIMPGGGFLPIPSYEICAAHPATTDAQNSTRKHLVVVMVLVRRTICRSAVWAPPSRRRDSTRCPCGDHISLQRLVGQPSREYS